MRGRTVVPERDAALLPLEAHREFRTRHVFPEQFENRLALARRHANNAFQKTRTDIERTLTRFRMHTHERMFTHQRALFHGIVKRVRSVRTRWRGEFVNPTQAIDKTTQRR